LEVAISVFLFEDETNGFFNIYKESARGCTTLLVVGHPTWPEVPIVLEHRTLGGVTTRLQRGSRLEDETIRRRGPYRAIRSGTTVILRPSIVFASISVDGAFFMKGVADKIHAWRVGDGRSHVVKSERCRERKCERSTI